MISQLDNFFAGLSDSLDVPQDQIKLLVFILMFIPYSQFFRLLTNPLLRHLVGTTTGLLISLYLYKEHMAWVFAKAVIVYTILCLYKEKAVKSVTIVTFSILFIATAYYQWKSYGQYKIDVTNILMTLVIKYQSLAFNIQDGSKKNENLSVYQQKFKVTEVPTFLEFLSFTFYFSTAICGPSMEFQDFKQFIELKGRYKQIANTLIPSLIAAAKGLSFVVAFMVLDPTYNCSHLKTSQYGEQDFLYKVFFFNVACTVNRFKYYGVWCLLQSSITGSGLSYNGQDKNNNELWDAVIICKPSLEFVASPKEKMDMWNMQTQNWLKNYIYLRIYSEQEIRQSAKKANIAQYVTFLISAFWHGLYPAYYLSMLHWAMVNMLSKFCFKLTNNKFNSKDSVLYKLWFYFQTIMFANLMNFYGAVFALQTLSSNFAFFNNTYWAVNLFVYFACGFFYITKYGQNPSTKQTKQE